MAALIMGYSAFFLGAVGIIATISSLAKGDIPRSQRTEMCTVLWFILAALCLK